MTRMDVVIKWWNCKVIEVSVSAFLFLWDYIKKCKRSMIKLKLCWVLKDFLPGLLIDLRFEKLLSFNLKVFVSCSSGDHHRTIVHINALSGKSKNVMQCWTFVLCRHDGDTYIIIAQVQSQSGQDSISYISLQSSSLLRHDLHIWWITKQGSFTKMQQFFLWSLAEFPKKIVWLFWHFPVGHAPGPTSLTAGAHHPQQHVGYVTGVWIPVVV